MREEALRIKSQVPQTSRARRWLAVGLLGVGVLVSGCARDGNATPQPAAATTVPTATSENEVLATIGDEKVTLADLRPHIGEQLDQLDSRYQRQRYKAIDAGLTRVIQDRVLAAEAKKQGKGLDQLISEEAGGPIDPSPADVKAWYDQNLTRVGGRPLAQVEAQIVDLLRKERRNIAAQKLEERLNKDHAVSVLLKPITVDLNNEGAPSLGPADAPVTLVEFSDFQCPYCQGMVSTLKRLKESHGDKVRIVYRQYPIPSLHANAMKAAEASLCAEEQGKFWEMHDLMFAEQNQLTVSELKEKAGRVKMNKSKFDDCMDKGRYVEQVQEDMKEGQKFGVSGTPAFFMNGVLLDGGFMTYEALVKVIDKELARVKK
jgi:protein-disulfide isomerase